MEPVSEKDSFVKATGKSRLSNGGQRRPPGFTHCLLSVALLDLGGFVVEEINGQRIVSGRNEECFNSDSKNYDIT